MQRIAAIEAIARGLGDLAAIGTSAGATGTTVNGGFLIHPQTDQLKGRYLYSRVAPAEERIISAFTPASNSITVEQGFGIYPTSAQIMVFNAFSKGDYDNALDRAIGKAALDYHVEYVATISLNATQYEYPVPSGLEFVHSLRLVPSGAQSDYSLDDEVRRFFDLDGYWRIEANEVGTFHVVFDPRILSLSVVDGEMIRVEGQSRLNVAATDSAVIPADIEDWVVERGAMYLASQRMTSAQDDAWRAKFTAHRDMALDLERFIRTPVRGVRVG